jgi:DNA helicase-2/ATP-dependent DNA helicase PcrA
VADLRATLTVLDDPAADAALLRLLTGPRWRIGPRDLAVLGRRARALVRGGGRAPDDPVEAVVLGVDDAQVGSLVDALDDLPPAGPQDPLSSEGRRRLERLRDELRALRRRTDQPLPDLVADVERTLLLDVEVSARSVDPAAARADLDAFADAAASFAGDTSQDGAGEAVLTAFLAHLTAAEDEEHGLDTGAISGADTVKLMTVHAAKGLEWPVVAVPGMARSASGRSAVFPARPVTGTSWTVNPRLLPFPLRGDRSELPALPGSSRRSWPPTSRPTRTATRARSAGSPTSRSPGPRRCCCARATTGGRAAPCSARRCSSTRPGRPAWTAPVRCWCGPTRRRRSTPSWARAAPRPGRRRRRRPARACRPPPSGCAAARRRAAGARPPADPRRHRRSGRRPALDADAAAAVAAGTTTCGGSPRRHAGAAAGGPPRSCPQRCRSPGWSSSAATRLRWPARCCARCRARPSPVTRRGTAFHAWLETTVFGQPQLLDPDDLPGRRRRGRGADEELTALQEAFRRSSWWGRLPAEIEVPFEMDVAGVLLRGRMDAVFAQPDGGWDVVDWKTGRPPTGADAEAAAVQLAAYRLAWHQLTGAPLETVSAAFVHVRSGTTVRPVDLLDLDGLRALVTGVELAPG